MGQDRREKCARFWWKSPKVRDHSKDRSVDWRIRSDWNLGRLVEGIQLAQNKDQWWALVNTVMNLRVLAPRSKLLSYTL
jgi:hypothetical protein